MLRNSTSLGLFHHIFSQQAPTCKDWFGEGSSEVTYKNAFYKNALWTVVRGALTNKESLNGAFKCIEDEDQLFVKEEKRDFLFDLCLKNKNALDATKEKNKPESKQKRSSPTRKRAQFYKDHRQF